MTKRKALSCVRCSALLSFPQRKYCGARCALLANSSVDNDGCWRWRGAISQPGGYGQLTLSVGANVPAKRFMAHKLSQETFNGPIPDGLCVMHVCDNRNCINPSHLRPGTQAENLRDCAKKGRNMRGESHYLTKLTEDDVRCILASDDRVGVLARKYNVQHTVVSNIRRGKTWKHIQREISL